MLNQSCLALPRSILMTEDRRSLTRTPRLPTRFCPLRAEHTLRRIFQSIAWCRQSNVSVVFLGVFFRQRCHVNMRAEVISSNHMAEVSLLQFSLLTSARKRHAGSNSSNIELLVMCFVQLILIILLYMYISNAFSLLRSAALIVQDHSLILTKSLIS